MLFTAPEYILLFLPLSVLAYFALVRSRMATAARLWLVLASLFFYGWWNPLHVPLLLASMAANFAAGRWLAAAAGRRPLLLATSIAANLGLLAWFKYAAFIALNIGAATGIALTPPAIALPLAISFYTFTQIAYLVDCHRGLVGRSSWLDYALFVTFFPHLIAGPVVHHADIMPAFARRANWVVRWPNILRGLLLFALGLAKKVLIADAFAPWARAGFDGGVPLDFASAWVTSLAYTFQIYFDFSGYSDMALGAALLFNIRLPVNFDSPYRAANIRDFWRRWHMTLSRFLRDYLYVPLGGNRDGAPRTGFNVLATFILGGLWHGAGWMFVIWGALHGIAVVFHRVWQRLGISMPVTLGWVLTFGYVNVAWVFFRARDLDAALNVLRGMAGLQGVGWPTCLAPAWPAASSVAVGCPGGIGAGWLTLPMLAVALALVMLPANSTRLAWATPLRHLARPWFGALAGLAGAAIALLAWSSPFTEFIYYNF